MNSPSLIVAVLILLFVGLIFYGIFVLVGKWSAPKTTPQIITGIALLLIYLLIGLQLFGIYKIADNTRLKPPEPRVLFSVNQ